MWLRYTTKGGAGIGRRIETADEAEAALRRLRCAARLESDAGELVGGVEEMDNADDGKPWWNWWLDRAAAEDSRPSPTSSRMGPMEPDKDDKAKDAADDDGSPEWRIIPFGVPREPGDEKRALDEDWLNKVPPAEDADKG